ncbi:hypothetical protein [Blastopirellula marina]|uniref:DUF4142 domain-containing protein n=1 Tax=Blastopirellula marina TaxID=124 RepID=A0A2S8GQN4_9BACT|nr:hypothetical protein [Blastopirellula marina]PQO46712.1 hypothetical protein C5Y93_07715 [Blastopirellula marina]
MTRFATFLLLLLLAAPILVGLGCASGAEEHAEHIDPPHRPQDFVAAVERLREIQIAAASEQAISTAHPSGDVVQEAADLLKWLPELAADSDLKRADWDKMYAATAGIRMEAAVWQGTSGKTYELRRVAEPLQETLPGLEANAAAIRRLKAEQFSLGDLPAEPVSEGSDT